MRNQTPFALCLIGGFFLITAGYNGGIDTIYFVYFFLHSITALASVYWLIDIVLLLLGIVAWLGGFAVIGGGYLLTTSYIRLGKFVIAIAAGFGLISLILVILWVAVVFGWGGLLVLTWLVLNISWALGLILTVIARSTAR